MDAEIRTILQQHGRLSVPVDGIADEQDLYQVGLASHASVNVMLALEDAFDIEFPEAMLRKRTFESVAAIRSAIETLTAGAG